MKLTIKERKLLEYVLLSELDHKEDDLRRYERRLRIDKDILKELKSDVKLLNSIKAKFLKSKIIEEEDL
tara:strand:+ start:339 stop:545 length:207 start_codon:yes stop_codon:yes gene_type:complete